MEEADRDYSPSKAIDGKTGGNTHPAVSTIGRTIYGRIWGGFWNGCFCITTMSVVKARKLLGHLEQIGSVGTGWEPTMARPL